MGCHREACKREKPPHITIETLIPDFNGNRELIDRVIASGPPNIVSHNMETVRRLTPKIRSRAKYDISLKTIEIIANNGKVKAKSGYNGGGWENQRRKLLKLWTT